MKTDTVCDQRQDVGRYGVGDAQICGQVMIKRVKVWCGEITRSAANLSSLGLSYKAGFDLVVMQYHRYG